MCNVLNVLSRSCQTIANIRISVMADEFAPHNVKIYSFGVQSATSSRQSRRLVRRKDASWSLNWPSGANLLARKQHMYFF